MKTQINFLKSAIVICLLFIGLHASTNAQALLSTKVVGKGQPMILIHGMSCSDGVWDEVVERYKGKYQLHLVSLAGFGNKQQIEKPHYLEAVKEELIAYIKKRKLHKPILMGHSMGGFLSLWAAADAPDLFDKIISVDGLPYFPVLQVPGLTPETAKPMVDNMKASMQKMDAKAYETQQRAMMAGMMRSPEKQEKVYAMGIASHQPTIGQAYSEMYTTDLRPKMDKIIAPVLVLGAWYAYQQYGVSRESSLAGYQSQVKNIANAKVALADTAYHFIFFDEPAWFYQQVDAFLAQN